MARGKLMRTCVAAELTGELAHQAARHALAEGPHNLPLAPRRNSPLALALAMNSPAAIHLIGKTWSAGRVLGVGFEDGSQAQRAKVVRWSQEWLKYGNLTLDFTSTQPVCRITFRPGPSWSNIGTDTLAVPSGPTMQLGWVTDGSDDTADRAVIVHEFGHFFGLGHEQSHPDNQIHWDKPKALAYFMRTQNWDAQTVQYNVFDVFDRAAVAGTAWDLHSIMQYPVDPALTLDHVGIPWNTDLSALDQQHFAAMYGPAFPQPTPVVPDPVAGAPVRLGGKATRVEIPAPGRPAIFSLVVPAAEVVHLAVVVERARGRAPIVLVKATNGAQYNLGLIRDQGDFLFQPGTYEFDVYNPIAAATGAAWMKASA